MIEKLEEFVQKVADLEKARKLLFEEFCIFILQNTSIKELNYIGYTPSFNDGDACYHSGEFGYNAYNEMLGRHSILLEFEGFSDLEDYDQHKVSNSEEKLYYKYILNFESVLTEEHNTNFHWSAVLRDGNLVTEVEEYDCRF